jgi:hypothetical protein
MDDIDKKRLHLSFDLCIKTRKYKTVTNLNHKNTTKHRKSVI